LASAGASARGSDSSRASLLSVGEHPITGEALAPATSTDPQENSINGHEYLIPDLDDLQYACIFPLASPLEGGHGHDCSPGSEAANRPICNPPSGGPAESTQYFAKAYPGTRHLQVLQGIGYNGVVTSICPKTLEGEPSNPAYGYNPAMNAIADRIRRHDLGGPCLRRQLPVEDGKIPCAFLEATLGPRDCLSEGRSVPDQAMSSAIRARLQSLGACGRGVPCDSYTLCELPQLTADSEAGERCQQNELAEREDLGVCYVDPTQGVGHPALVSHCPGDREYSLRFVPDELPTSGAIMFIACAGEAFLDP
jgi:hypothetical protein